MAALEVVFFEPIENDQQPLILVEDLGKQPEFIIEQSSLVKLVEDDAEHHDDIDQDNRQERELDFDIADNSHKLVDQATETDHEADGHQNLRSDLEALAIIEANALQDAPTRQRK